MRNLNKIVLLFIPLASSLSAQQVPVGARTGTARRVMGDRDNGKGVASLFEKTRSTLKAPHVGRISSTLNTVGTRRKISFSATFHPYLRRSVPAVSSPDRQEG